MIFPTIGFLGMPNLEFFPSIFQRYTSSILLMYILLHDSDHGASVSLSDNSGSTGLHYAAKHGYDRVGRLLLNKGCAINTINHQGDGDYNIVMVVVKVVILIAELMIISAIARIYIKIEF